MFSFQPADIIDQLNLRRPIFLKTTNYGHFGKSDKDLTWEATNKVQALLKAIASSRAAATMQRLDKRVHSQAGLTPSLVLQLFLHRHDDRIFDPYGQRRTR